MDKVRSELLDLAILRMVELGQAEQDRIAIEILADLCSEEEWALLAASDAYHKWVGAQPEEEPEQGHSSLSTPVI